MLQVLRLQRGLELGISREGVAVFNDFERVRKVIERQHTKAPWREQLCKFCTLLAVVGANDNRQTRCWFQS